MAEQGGVEWEIGRAVDELVELFPDEPGLRKALGDYAAGVGGLASSQAAKSTVFLVKKINKLIEDVADIKTLVRDLNERMERLEAQLSKDTA